MSIDAYDEMERECLTRVLAHLCRQTGLDPEAVFEDATYKTAANFGDKECAYELKERLFPAV